MTTIDDDKPAPPPWVVGVHDWGEELPYGVAVASEPKWFMAHGMTKATAEYIVSVVNQHDALVAALETLAATMGCQCLTDKYPGDEHDSVFCVTIRDALDAVQ